MNTNKNNEFAPDYAVHPGVILNEIVTARGMKKRDLASACGMEEKTMSQILNGKAPIEPKTAIGLQRIVGIPAETWSNLNAMYELFKKRLEDREENRKQIEWAKSFPIKEIVKRGFFGKPQNDIDAVEKILTFFGAGSVEAWKKRISAMRVAYKHSPAFVSEQESMAAWLRMGELLAGNTDTEPYTRQKFVSAIKKIRGLTTASHEVFEPEMVNACGEAGVALVFVKELTNTHLSGAAHWLNSEKALIILSLRYKWEDHFWFAFFHEAAHILLHGKKEGFIDINNNKDVSEDEDEANRFASETLIPHQKYAEFTGKMKFLKPDIIKFAKSENISPSIVVGRLQRDRFIQFNWHNDLRRKFEITERKQCE